MEIEMGKMATTNSENEKAVINAFDNPVFAWSETKWYAECSLCGAKNEVDRNDCFSGSTTGKNCQHCGERFFFRNDI